MMRNLGLLVFLGYDSWLGWWNEQLWCLVLWKIMDFGYGSYMGRGFHDGEDEKWVFDSKKIYVLCFGGS
jgi:hypothetical protein